MSISIREIRRFEYALHTRMPFRYGIATLTALPHAFVEADVEVDGRVVRGIAADHLPPKWFTKDPETSTDHDIAEMRSVIYSACAKAKLARPAPTVFDFWRQLYDLVQLQDVETGFRRPPLLAHFGTSLVERAVIDAACRAWGISFGQAVRENRLGIRLSDIHPELGNAKPAELLPAAPLTSVNMRHTVGLTDPIRDADIPAGERLDDGLPQSFEACIKAYGLTHFKIKLWGDLTRDFERVLQLAEVIEARAGAAYAFTLDFNENFKQVDVLRGLWESLTSEPRIASFLQRLLFVEQPLHREVAMDADATPLLQWKDRPPIIIDESDGTVHTARKAVEMGYAGTSHKNCKGVFKSIANACLFEQRRRINGRALILSAEDLCNVGPVALPQDLCVAANLGITHVERNGHHYFRGMSLFPLEVQETALRAHPDLYRRHEGGFVAPAIAGGRMATGSLVRHALGVNFDVNPAAFAQAMPPA